MPAPTIRRMEHGDLAGGHKLTRSVGWSHRLEDWEFHFRLGRGYVAQAAAGEIAGTAMWWAWGPDFGCVGLIVVDPGQQGRGIGAQLMDALFEETGDRGLQLVATEAGLKLYRRCGFRELGGIEQRQGEVRQRATVAPPEGLQLRPVTPADLPRLAALDAAAFGAERHALIAAVLAAGRGVVAEGAGGLGGFALARPSGRGTLLGPVVATTEAIAASMATSLFASVAGFARMDIPEEAVALSGWLDAAGLKRVDRVLAMQRGARPGRPGAHATFGLASQALG